MSYNIANLPKFSDTKSREFILETVFGGQTLDSIEKNGAYHADAQVGSQDIQLLDTDVVWQSGTCKLVPVGEVKLGREPLVVKQIAMDIELCNADLEDTYASADLNAERNGLALDDAKFLDFIMADIEAKNTAKLETLVWQGDVSLTTDNTRKWYNGFLKQLETGTIDASAVTGTNIIEFLQNAYLAMPSEIVSQPDFTIYISKTDYAKYKIAVQKANLFDAGNPLELVGTDAKFTIVDGLNAPKKAVLSRARNLRAGGRINDMGVKNIYDEIQEVVHVRVRLSSGVTAIYKHEIMVIDLSGF